MPTQKIDPKVIFASDAPAIDKPPVFGDKTKGWDVARANDGRPEIKQMNKMQQDTDLKILWLNENAALPYDASIDYPDGVVTIKDGSFKQLSGGSWVEFLDDFADKDAVKRGIANRYDSSLTYNLGDRVALTNGDIVKSMIEGNIDNPNVDMAGWAYSSLTPSNNLSDVANKEASRNNLSVYSKAEVDAKKATESEAISGADNTKFVTPLSLSAAIKALTINSALTQRDVTAQRFLNTNYTNSNASMKIVLVGFKLPQNANVDLSVGGIIQGFVTNFTAQQTDNYLSLVGFIKPNETYRFNTVTGSPTIQFCMEISL